MSPAAAQQARTGGASRRAGRVAWHRFTGAVVLGYVAAAGVALLLHGFGAAPTWLVVHLLLLGAATNAIVVWTGHFVPALAHTPRASRRWDAGVAGALNVGVLAVVVGVGAGTTRLVLVGAAVLLLAVGGHASGLVGAARRTPPGPAPSRRSARTGSSRRPRPADPFAGAVPFMAAAAVAFVVGVAAGTALVVGVPTAWYPRVYATHVHLEAFGWVSLTVLGTELALWPMALRTRVSRTVRRIAWVAVPACVLGLAAIVTGLLAGLLPLVTAGVAAYLVGVAACLVPFVETARRRPPQDAATWMLAAATGWLVVALVLDLRGTLTAGGDVAALAAVLRSVVPWLLTGFVAQVLAGALSYLLPVVLGRGPLGARQLAARLTRFGGVRVVALNLGVLLAALPVPGPARLAGWALVAAALAAFAVLAGGCLLDRAANGGGGGAGG